MTECTISGKAAIEVIRLIDEYLFQGGDGRDEELLVEAREALEMADRIVIQGDD